jgi:hypothetical protein
MFCSDNVIKCTIREDFATKFLNFNNNNTNAGTTIVCMKYAKINKEGYVFLTLLSLVDFNELLF